MKILHIIDNTYFETHRKTISELILSLSTEGIEQKIYTNPNTSLGWLEKICEVIRWKISKKGKIKSLSNKIKTWFVFSAFHPDIVIKWGKQAREIAYGAGGIQISFINEKEPLKSFENTDYIMTNIDEVLSYLKSHGYSGMRSFLLPPFIYEYKKVPTLNKKDYFIPEKAKIIYIAGTLIKNIGYERAFEALSIISDTYFFVIGNGPDEEYVKDQALKVNLKARSRFIPEIEKSFNALDLVEFSFLPFEDPELPKYILESMIQKKIVITIKTPQSEEFITEGKTGFFIPKQDMYLIKKKIKEVMNLPENEKQNIINNAYEQAKEYTSSKKIKGYVQMFDELIKKYNERKNLLNN